MPTLASAKKRLRQDLKRRLRNRSVKQALRTQLGKFLHALEAGDLELARQEFKNSVRALDKTATKGVIHQNAAARRKSQFAKKLAALETTQAATRETESTT